MLLRLLSLRWLALFGFVVQRKMTTAEKGQQVSYFYTAVKSQFSSVVRASAHIQEALLALFGFVA